MALLPEAIKRFGPYEIEVRDLIFKIERGEASNEDLDTLLDRGPTVEQATVKQQLWERLDQERKQQGFGKKCLVNFLKWVLGLLK